MSNMKRLLESIQEAKRLTQSQPLDEEGLTSLFQTVQDIAAHGNAGVSLLAGIAGFGYLISRLKDRPDDDDDDPDDPTFGAVV